MPAKRFKFKVRAKYGNRGNISRLDQLDIFEQLDEGSGGLIQIGLTSEQKAWMDARNFSLTITNREGKPLTSTGLSVSADRAEELFGEPRWLPAVYTASDVATALQQLSAELLERVVEFDELKAD